MKTPPKIFFVHSGNEAFVSLDRELLSEFATIEDFYANQKFPINIFKYLIGIWNTDIVFCWFSSWNSFWAIFIAKLFNKKSVLVIGGYDLANLPEIKYGNQRGGIMKLVSRAAMHLATILFTNSAYSREEAGKNAKLIDDRIHVIYHGVPDIFNSFPEGKRAKDILTVGNIDWPNLQRKGLEIFVRAASYLENYNFILVGNWSDDSVKYLQSIASSNVSFPGRVSDNDLKMYYEKSSVYVQASLHEGFGMSVAESMLGGCIPVVSRNGALPEVVGECGFYCEILEPSNLAEVICQALKASDELRSEARERVLYKFTLEKRGKEIRKLIMSLVN